VKESNWNWIEDACQALVFWLGYQERRSHRHTIREIAVVTELLALLDAKSSRKGFNVYCEQTFNKLLKGNDCPNELKQKRADIIVSDRDENITHVLEVKKVDSKIPLCPKAHWVNDLRKLECLNKYNPQLSCRLVLVTGSALPSQWLTNSGRSVRTHQTIDSVKFKIRRILKAYPFLPSIDSGNRRLLLNKGPAVVLIEPVV
jgi:hypothetical protein